MDTKLAMPGHWAGEQKLFPHQVGVTCPPFDFAATPSELLRMSPQSIGVHECTLPNGWKTRDYCWWDGGSFHANPKASTGLKPQVRRYLEVNEAPDRVQRVHHRMKPHYDHLHQHRILPT